MFQCQACGQQGPGRRARKFCSNACQQAAQRQALLTDWLTTGECIAHSSRGHYVREHIAAEQGGVCAMCDQPADWMGLPLAFILDHVDGDATNNARENLRLVCPNCDSQLPTYKARNKGRGRRARRVG